MSFRLFRYFIKAISPGIVLLAVVALVSSITDSSCAADDMGKGFMKTNGTITVGQAAPAIIGEDLDGKKITVESLKGRPVFMDFSSIFCASCQDTIKEFKHLQEIYKGTDLELIIVVDGAASVKALKNYFKELGATYTVIRDQGYVLFEGYGVSNIPFQVVIDRKGTIQKIHVGFDPKMEAVMGLKELVRK